jgi:serine/threonine protein kinase
MMSLPPKKIEPNMVYLDPFLMDRVRINAGLSRKKLATESTLAVNTVLDAFNCGGLQPFKAKLLAKALGCQVTELLAPWDSLYKVPANPPEPWSGSPEWEPIGYLEQGRLAPNGLYYIVFRMQHRHTKAKLGRGKFYHLSWLPTTKRAGMQHQLSRHADVCARVGVHPHIVVNHTSTPVANDEGWWVIDDWVGEKNLAQYLVNNAWPSEGLPRLLLEIAQGLDALHRAGIIFRELAPARVLIADRGGRSVLTDFELAKLLDGGPSVSSEWPEDPFRAPEVEGGTVTEGADLYSLAMVAAAAIAGPAFDPGHAVTILKASNVPKQPLHLLVECLKPLDRRPSELMPVLKELTRWTRG